MSDILALCDTVRVTCLAIHRYFRSGHLEKVYENALAHRLRKNAIEVKQQIPIDIHDEDGTLVGHYTADRRMNTSLKYLGISGDLDYDTGCLSTSALRNPRSEN